MSEEINNIVPVGNFPAVFATLGEHQLLATVDSGSTLNLMPLRSAQAYGYKIDTSKASTLTLARGNTRTDGTVKLKLTIAHVSHNNNLSSSRLHVFTTHWRVHMQALWPSTGLYHTQGDSPIAHHSRVLTHGRCSRGSL